MKQAIHSVLFAVLLGAGTAAFPHGTPHRGNPPLPPAAAAQEREQKAWGIAGDMQAVQRTLEIRMSDDMRFSPERIRVRQGETVRFRVHNAGQVLHEMVIGTREALEEHAALMVRFPGMEHDEPHMAHVEPGRTGELVWTFNRVGEFAFACLIPGHHEAGMIGAIEVVE